MECWGEGGDTAWPPWRERGLILIREKKVNVPGIIKAVGGVLNIFLNKRAVKILRRGHLERPEKDFTE